jgi:hypothetical protein
MEQTAADERHGANNDTSTDPVALSLAAGFAGTVTGLQRGGLPSAVALGLVSGTAGYVIGAAADSPRRPQSTPTADPVQITVDKNTGTKDVDEAADTDTTGASDADSDTDGTDTDSGGE